MSIPTQHNGGNGHADGHPNPISIPVHQEDITIEKRVVETGHGVRVDKRVNELPYHIDETLLREDIDVRRVPVDRIVALNEAPQSRHEGDTLILPVVEEVVVVERRLRIKEEIHITRIQRQDRVQDTVFLKSEEVRIERFDDAS